MLRLLLYSCACVRIQIVHTQLPFFAAVSARSMRSWRRTLLARGVAVKRVRTFPHLPGASAVLVCVLRTLVYNPAGSESPRTQLGRSIPPSPPQNGLGVHLGPAPRPSTPRPHPLSGVVKRDLPEGQPSWRAIGGTVHTARACDSNQVV